MGSFDEGRVAREFGEYAGLRMLASDRLLRIPYHAFTRPLRQRLHGGAPRPAPASLPPDFLPRSLPGVPAGGPPPAPAPAGGERPADRPEVVEELSCALTGDPLTPPPPGILAPEAAAALAELTAEVPNQRRAAWHRLPELLSR